MSELTGQVIDDSFGMFPPFSSDCGKNIHLGKNVFINAGCKFQDQGGITIDDGALIGHNAVLATINHLEDPCQRGNAGCKFQDQGGITIDDGALIGHNAVLATINHLEDPCQRGSMVFYPIHPFKGRTHHQRSPGISFDRG